MNRLKMFFVWFCFSVFLILPPFLLGGVYSHIGTNLIIIFTTSLASLCFILYLFVFKKPMAISSIVFPLGAIFVYAIIQLIPLPLSLLKILSPQAYFFHLIEGTGSRPLTMSITDTIYSIARVFVLLLFSFIVARTVYLGTKIWKQVLIDTIIYISTIVIVISASLRIIQAQSWLSGTLRHPGFLLEPILINPNHAASFFGISAFLALTSIYSSEFNRKKIFYGALFFLHSVAVVATLSRGGIFAFIISLLFFLFVSKTSTDKRGGLKFYLAVSFIMLSLFTVFYTGYSIIEKEFDFERDGYFNKIEEMGTVEKYFKDFAFTGSGLGSFSRVYPFYQSDPERRFTEMENEPVQYILENGLFFALFIFLCFIWTIIAGKRETKRKNGLVTVLFFVLIHNTVDFNLHNFSTLLPVTAVLVLLVKPLNIKGIQKNSVFAFSMLAAFFMMYISLTENGRKLVGYSDSYSYSESVYYYPSDYLIPMAEAVNRLNSSDKTVVSSVGVYASSAISKAPLYYFNYYLTGNYLLRLGSTVESLEFYKKSIELSGKKYPIVLRRIYNDFKMSGISERITEIISIENSDIVELERFLFEISKTNNNSLKFIHNNEKHFFISAIRSYLEKKDYGSAQKLIEKIEKSESGLMPNQKGRLFVYKGAVYDAEKDYEKAFEYYIKGADITGGFFDYLAGANCALKLDKNAIDKIDKKLKTSALKSSVNLSYYYKWLSKREFMYNNYIDGLKYLEKASDISKKPEWRFELADIYGKRGMYAISLRHLHKIKKDYPDFRKEKVIQIFEEQQKKLSAKEKENLNELLLRK